MKQPIVIIGIGELAGVLARAFLRNGHPVHPITRSMNIAEAADNLPDPCMVVVAVAEKDYPAVMETMPEQWRNHLVLIQNELLPRDWETYGVQNPTVLSVWFEKKKGMDSKVIIPSPVYGKHAQQVADALASIDIAARVLADEAELVHELVLKNVYILTTNIAGIEVGGNVGQLWDEHRLLAESVALEVIRLQEALTGQTLDHQGLIDGMVNAFDGDLEHMCMGRSAPVRLQRALMLAEQNELSLSMLQRVAAL